MKKYILVLTCLYLAFDLYGQDQETIKLKPQEIEAIFLEQNLELLAEQVNISIAEAEIMQAKLWDNPTLSINDVNLWSTKSQRDGESEVIPPLFGSFAKNTQFSVELSQLIQTANKRGKLVARETVSKEMAAQQFDVLLRGLKIELRKAINEIIYLQDYKNILSAQQESIEQLVEAYRRQVVQGNIAKSELLRLQSSLLEIENELNETEMDYNEQMKNLKSLLAINPLVHIEIIDSESVIVKPEAIILPLLLEQTVENRSEIKLQKLQTQYFDKSVAYEKSLRVPDITFNANYDRYGGVWQNFIGFGVSIDLPFVNRNQGGIKAAQLGREQSLYEEKQQINQVQNEAVEAYRNYTQAYNFYQKVNANDLLPELDNMLSVYTKNLLNKNISMLEYIDFMETYKDNKQTMLSAEKRMHIQFEELQYIVGKDINNIL